jgi:hypothetical protein
MPTSARVCASLDGVGNFASRRDLAEPPWAASNSMRAKPLLLVPVPITCRCGLRTVRRSWERVRSCGGGSRRRHRTMRPSSKRTASSKLRDAHRRARPLPKSKFLIWGQRAVRVIRPVALGATCPNKLNAIQSLQPPEVVDRAGRCDGIVRGDPPGFPRWRLAGPDGRRAALAVGRFRTGSLNRQCLQGAGQPAKRTDSGCDGASLRRASTKLEDAASTPAIAITER